VAAEDVYPAARELAAEFVTGPMYALRAAKHAIDQGLETDLDTGLAIERAQFAALFATEDRTRGMRGFLDHGPGKAEFVGR
jgi:enoyl-CoA hydratase/carnithine racemase